jgi:hypothetical protein
MERLYVITINWAQTPDVAKIEAVLPGRWLRFSASSWLLWERRALRKYMVLLRRS